MASTRQPNVRVDAAAVNYESIQVSRMENNVNPLASNDLLCGVTAIGPSWRSTQPRLFREVRHHERMLRQERPTKVRARRSQEILGGTLQSQPRRWHVGTEPPW